MNYNLILEGSNDRPDDNYDSNQLEMGIEIEKEHTDDPIISKIIAKDHLDECSDYYTRLKQMEEKCEDNIKPSDMDNLISED